VYLIKRRSNTFNREVKGRKSISEFLNQAVIVLISISSNYRAPLFFMIECLSDDPTAANWEAIL
jgi:hypothetical protein